VVGHKMHHDERSEILSDAPARSYKTLDEVSSPRVRLASSASYWSSGSSRSSFDVPSSPHPRATTMSSSSLSQRTYEFVASDDDAMGREKLPLPYHYYVGVFTVLW